MLFFKTNHKQSRCQEWFDFKVLILLKVIFLLWGLAILGIYLKMPQITRGFKIALPVALILFVLSLFSKNKTSKEKGIVLFLFALLLLLATKIMDISYGTHYFSGMKL